jgi:hypothetical protein
MSSSNGILEVLVYVIYLVHHIDAIPYLTCRGAPVKKEFGQQADMSNPTPFPGSVPGTPPVEGAETVAAPAEIIQALESVVEESEP